VHKGYRSLYINRLSLLSVVPTRAPVPMNKHDRAYSGCNTG